MSKKNNIIEDFNVEKATGSTYLTVVLASNIEKFPSGIVGLFVELLIVDIESERVYSSNEVYFETVSELHNLQIIKVLEAENISFTSMPDLSSYVFHSEIRGADDDYHHGKHLHHVKLVAAPALKN